MHKGRNYPVHQALRTYAWGQSWDNYPAKNYTVFIQDFSGPLASFCTPGEVVLSLFGFEFGNTHFEFRGAIENSLDMDIQAGFLYELEPSGWEMSWWQMIWVENVEQLEVLGKNQNDNYWTGPGTSDVNRPPLPGALLWSDTMQGTGAKPW